MSKTTIKRTIKDQIYDIIKERILAEEFRLGDKINIMSLSAELGVSNTPVREALSMLERDGLVVVTPNAGPRVIEYSPQLFSTIENAVEALVLGAFDLVIDLGKKDDLCAGLEKALAKQVATYKTADDHEHTRLSQHFDSCFVYTAGNDYLNRMYEGLIDIFYLVSLYDLSSDGSERLTFIEEHRRILDALKENRIDETRRLICRHYARM